MSVCTKFWSEFAHRRHDEALKADASDCDEKVMRAYFACMPESDGRELKKQVYDAEKGVFDALMKAEPTDFVHRVSKAAELATVHGAFMTMAINSVREVLARLSASGPSAATAPAIAAIADPKSTSPPCFLGFAEFARAVAGCNCLFARPKFAPRCGWNLLYPLAVREVKNRAVLRPDEYQPRCRRGPHGGD